MPLQLSLVPTLESWRHFEIHCRLDTMYFPEARDFVEWYVAHWQQDPTRRCVIVLRGLPGSGKSTFAEQIVEAVEPHGIISAVCSARDFLTANAQGERVYDVGQLERCHNMCRAKFVRHLTALPGHEDYAHLIFVDNTNIRLDELEFYVTSARGVSIRWHIYRFLCRTDEEAATQCLRCIYRVPLMTVLRRFALFGGVEPGENLVTPKYEDADAYRLEARIPNF